MEAQGQFYGQGFYGEASGGGKMTLCTSRGGNDCRKSLRGNATNNNETAAAAAVAPLAVAGDGPSSSAPVRHTSPPKRSVPFASPRLPPPSSGRKRRTRTI